MRARRSYVAGALWSSVFCVMLFALRSILYGPLVSLHFHQESRSTHEKEILCDSPVRHVVHCLLFQWYSRGRAHCVFLPHIQVDFLLPHYYSRYGCPPRILHLLWTGLRNVHSGSCMCLEQFFHGRPIVDPIG